MGRKVVVELRCDRCRKVEHVSQEGNSTVVGPVFSWSFMGKEVKYDDLCTGCREVVATHWVDITKDMRKVTPRRKNDNREAAMSKVTGAGPVKPVSAPPVPSKPAPGLGERKTDSSGSSQRP